MIFRFVLLAGALGLLSSPLGSDAFTARPAANSIRRTYSSTSTTTSLASSPPQQQQFYDANGNAVTMPMVYDANGNLVPFNPPAAMQMPPPLNIVEPSLPPRTKGNDEDRPVGKNPDAHTMANTADVYMSQLKQDSKVRKHARMSGDIEYANQVFADDSVKQLGDSWVDNPYTKE